MALTSLEYRAECSGSEDAAQPLSSLTPCPLFRPQLLRCMSHRNDGLIQVIRWNENGGTNCPAARAASAMAGEYAW